MEHGTGLKLKDFALSWYEQAAESSPKTKLFARPHFYGYTQVHYFVWIATLKRSIFPFWNCFEPSLLCVSRSVPLRST
jgi:hypothetical protein